MVILIAEDEAAIRQTLIDALGSDHRVIACENGEQAIEELKKTAIDLVITDNQMPGVTGMELIRLGKTLSPTTSFLLVTAFGSVKQAVEAIQAGADDYLIKPFDLSELDHRIRRIEDLRAWKAQSILTADSRKTAPRLIGKSAAIQRAQEFIETVSSAASPVLITGASGTGKEVLAKSIHETGNRGNQPFIAINCAALVENLLESELFGHEKGAFTGAASAKPGKFELAGRGTIFLDEIGELAPSIQAKLLRVLQEKEFFRVGGTRQIQTEARIVAATHRDLKAMVKAGTFREDLYFRLNVLSFHLPSLQERPDDIPLLIQHLWSKLCTEVGRKAELAPATLAPLCRYAYPGNVRELQNVLERLIVLGAKADKIGPEYLPPEFFVKGAAVTPISSGDGRGLVERVEALESQLVAEAMQRFHGNQVKAAKHLQVSRGALQNKLRKYGLSTTSENQNDEAA